MAYLKMSSHPPPKVTDKKRRPGDDRPYTFKQIVRNLADDLKGVNFFIYNTYKNVWTQDSSLFFTRGTYISISLICLIK